MPVLRVTVEVLHPENFTKDSAAAAAQKLLAERLSEIMSYYRAQQANSHVSGLPLSQTHKVSNGIELRHTNLNGLPVLDVRVTVDADAEGDSALVMMVLHSGNQITAFDMKALDNGKLSKVYSAALQQSSWGNAALMTTQYRYAKDWTVVYGPLAFSGSTISSQSYFYLSRTNNKLAASCLTQSVSSRTPRYFDEVNNKTFDPLVTNSGDTFYTPYDNYTISKDGITFSGDGSSIEDSPYVIDKTGLAYYGVNSSDVYAVVNTDVVSSTQLRHYYGYRGYLKPVGAAKSVEDAANEIEATLGAAFFDFVGYYRGLNVVINTAYAPYQDSFAPNPYADPDLSLDLPFLTCTQTADLDVLDVDMRNVSMMMSGAWQLAVSQPTFTATLDGVSAVVHESTYEALYLIAWPPGVSNKRYFVKGVGINPNVTFTVYTPYEQFTVYSDTFYARDAIRFFPRLHASNGKHILQGFTAEADTRFYLDGAEIGAKLATLCGCAVDDIQSILLDIPLARIKQFK